MLDASPQTAARITENWLRVRDEVATAARMADRAIQDIRIVGVSKYVDVELTAQLVDAGCHALGESRPQNLWGKAEVLRQSNREIEWHLIGHLQRNKIRRTLSQITWLHSLDSLRLAEALNAELKTAHESNAPSAALNGPQITPKRLNVLVEVNVTQDTTKTGMMVDALYQAIDQMLDLPHLSLRGLMAMSSRDTGGVETRREFAAVRQLRDDLQVRCGPRAVLDQLSMGMSGDYREAISEGATMVRIGSSLWQGILP